MIIQHRLSKLSPKYRDQFIAKHENKFYWIRHGMHGLYWRTNRMGYCEKSSVAGIYSLREALAASGHCGPEKQIVYVPIDAAKEIAKYNLIKGLYAEKTALLDKYGVFGGGQEVNLKHQRINSQLESLGVNP